MSIFVTDVWVIPALPLLAFLLNIAVLRPLDVATRDRGHAAGHDAHGHSTHAASGHDETHGAVGDPEQHDASQSADHELPTPDEAYVRAMDTIDGHIDTQAAMPRALRKANQTSEGGHAFVDLMVADEEHPEHPHGQPTIFARINGYMSIVFMTAAFVWSLGVLFALMGNPTLQRGTTVSIYTWINVANLRYPIDFYVDSLTAIMLVVVTGISLLVQFYSQAYIEGEEPRGYSRFFAWLSIFSLSMLLLVLASNFLLIYMGWELVGLSSYLLIGFLAKDGPKLGVLLRNMLTPRGLASIPQDALDLQSGRPSPGAAAVKAFVVNRIGDFGFLIGILILFTITGTFVFTEIPARLGGVNVTLLTIAMILVFCGAIGKSAQFPLHVWLPDAMEGPTPVSALIHAATMVAAGVYLVARTFPLFHIAGPQALQVVAYIGGFTAIFAASIALVQQDAKRVLAYSTVSQLGYMFVGLGVADSIGPGIFHLMTHAFFKALLFLGSGGVLLAVSMNQDMRRMGGLASRIPMVAIPFLLATFSIAGFPFFAGFFSKDEIIAQTWEHGDYLLYFMTLFTAFLTAFYMFRMWFLTFGGKGGAFGGWWGGEYRGTTPVKKPDFRVWLPLWILAVPSVIAGFWGWSAVGGNFNAFITGNPSAPAFGNPFTSWLTILGVGASVLGILLAWGMYGLGVVPRRIFVGNPLGKGIATVLWNKYYLDEIYLALVRYVVMGLSKVASFIIDKRIIDGILDGTGAGVIAFGRGLRRSESGRLQSYGAAIFGGVLVIAAVFFAVVYFGK
jgi:NADH-quinone oxidoreductase subunit L